LQLSLPPSLPPSLLLSSPHSRQIYARYSSASEEEVGEVGIEGGLEEEEAEVFELLDFTGPVLVGGGGGEGKRGERER